MDKVKVKIASAQYQPHSVQVFRRMHCRLGFGNSVPEARKFADTGPSSEEWLRQETRTQLQCVKPYQISINCGPAGGQDRYAGFTILYSL
jgi:hypothetical protein